MDGPNRHDPQTLNLLRLPEKLRALFWECDFEALTWEDDRDLIIRRVLTSGNWDAVMWLRSHMGDRNLREWIERHHGSGLSPQRLRFWEVLLGLSHHQVNTWLATEKPAIWDKRVGL